jgi:hypothetical protein
LSTHTHTRHANAHAHAHAHTSTQRQQRDSVVSARGFGNVSTTAVSACGGPVGMRGCHAARCTAVARRKQWSDVALAQSLSLACKGGPKLYKTHGR